MKLLDNWKDVFKSAWSMKAIGFAAFLEIASNVVPVLSDYIPWWVTVIVLAAAAGARLIKQPVAAEVTDAGK